jgi:hypothetical protein
LTASLSRYEAPALRGAIDRAPLARPSGRWTSVPLWPAAAMFGLSLAVSVALYVFRPISNGHQYQLAVRVTALLALIWGISTFRARWLGEPRFLGLVFALGLYCAVSRPLTIKQDSEIVAAYGSAFAALDAGKNPYDSGTIVHFDEHGEHKLGNFNYPPVEIVPYYAVAKLWGRWDHRVLTWVLIAVQALACALLWSTFRERVRGAPSVVLAFAPLLICFELHTNVALSLLAVALVMRLILRPVHAGQRRNEWTPMLTFGVALLTKFLIIPLFATYVLHRLPRRGWRSWAAWRACSVPIAGTAAALLVALGLMLPFGVGNVLRETLLFNLVLSERAKLTTFYPNVLSGTLTWLGVPGAFPALAVLLLGAAILWSRRLPLAHALPFTGAAFLLVSPTPEPQYIPVIVYLALCAALHGGVPARASVERASGEGAAARRPPS